MGSRFRVGVGLILVFLVLLIFSKAQLLRYGWPGAEVTVSVEPTASGTPTNLSLSVRHGKTWREWAPAPDSPNRWDIDGSWISELRLAVPRNQLDRVGSVSVKFQDRTVAQSLQELQRFETGEPPTQTENGRKILFDLSSALPPPKREISWFADIRNWPGDEKVVGPLLRECASPILLLAVFLIWVVVARRTKLRDFAAEWLAEPSQPTRLRDHWWWELVGILFLVGSITFLEVRHPKYFTQDDAFIVEIPVCVYGARCIWEGEIPEYNPFNYMGSALASTSMSQTTYPPMYLSYAIARHILGDDYLIAEVSSVLHLLVGYALMRWLGWRLGLGRLPAVLLALSFVLSGSVLIFGRSWHMFLQSAVWIPAVGHCTLTLATKPVGWRWVLATGAIIGCFLHVGFTQIPAFACGFLLVAAAYLRFTGAIPTRRALLVIPAFVIGLGIAAPNLYIQLQLMSGNKRGYVAYPSANGAVPAMLLPYPIVRDCNLDALITTHAERGGHAAYFGGLLAWLCLLEFLAIVLHGIPRPEWARRIWLALAGLAFVLSLGEAGLLWPLGGLAPVIESLFRYPCRMLPFMTFFACAAGGLVLDRLLRRVNSPRTELVLGIGALLLLGQHVYQAMPTFHAYSFPNEVQLPAVYAPMVEETSELRSRLLPISIRHSPDPRSGYSLAMNRNLLFRLPSVDGYLPICENATFLRAYDRLRDDPLAACRAYGVGWVVVFAEPTPENSQLPQLWPNEIQNGRLGLRLLPLLQPPVEAEGVRVYRIPDVAPLGFATGSPTKPLEITVHGDGMELNVRGVAAGDDVVANFLWYPQIRAELDGKPIPTRADEWERIRITLPESGSRLRIRYRPNWWKGIGIGAGIAALGLVLAGVLLRRREVVEEPEAGAVAPPPAAA